MSAVAYKESNIKWLGRVPHDWNLAKIKRYCLVKRGASPRPIDDLKYFSDHGEYSWVRISDVTASDKYLKSTEQRLSELGASLSVKREPGDIFVSICASVGKPIISEIKCCIHDGFVWFDRLKIDKEYLYFLFTSGEMFKGLGNWGTQLNLNTDIIGEIVIPLPPPAVQHRIAAYLDEQTEKIDRLMDMRRRQITLLKEQRAALIQRAVTRGINPNVPMKESGMPWLREIPAHWEVTKLKYLARLKSGESITSDEINESGNYPVFGGNGLRGYANTYTHKGHYVLVGRQGALCGNVNYAAGKFWASEHAVVSSLVSGNEVLWFGEILRVMNLNQYSQAAAQPGLAVEKIQNLYIPVPPHSEQVVIARYIESESAKFKNLISSYVRQLNLLAEYRAALIHECVTGQRPVPNRHTQAEETAHVL
jgi:type I restriction enzyme S subunit